MALNKVSFKVCCTQLNKVIKTNSIPSITFCSITLSVIYVFLHVYADLGVCECVCVCAPCQQMMFLAYSSVVVKDFLLYDNISHLFDA